MAPVVTITGASTGDGVRPGQQTTVIVSPGPWRRHRHQLLDSRTHQHERRTHVVAAQNNALTSFTFQVPAFAQPGDSVTLRATAKDRAGNVGTAANVILPVVDTVAPTAQLRTSTGSLTIAPGGTVDVIVDTSDGIGVSRVELVGSGAFSFSDAQTGGPPTGEAHITFTIAVPATLQPGDVLNLQARAIDLANNVSAPAFLSLVTRAFAEVVLPPSVILNAGRFVDVPVQLPEGAPAGGQLVTFTTGHQAVATATSSVLFAAGETARTVRVNGVSGGTTQLSARVQGVERASMTITVQGGVVEGFVFDSTLSPAPGAQVTVTGAGLPVSAVTDGQGRYLVTGVNRRSGDRASAG